MVRLALFLLRLPFVTAANYSLDTGRRCSTISFNRHSTAAVIDFAHHTATSRSTDPAGPHTVIGIVTIETNPSSTALVQQQLQHSPNYWRSRLFDC